MGTHPIFESDFDCLTGGPKSPKWLTSRLTRSVRSWTRRRTSVICPLSLTSIMVNPLSLTPSSVRPVSLPVPRLVKLVSPTLVRTNKNVVLLSSPLLFLFSTNWQNRLPEPQCSKSRPTYRSMNPSDLTPIFVPQHLVRLSHNVLSIIGRQLFKIHWKKVHWPTRSSSQQENEKVFRLNYHHWIDSLINYNLCPIFDPWGKHLPLQCT